MPIAEAKNTYRERVYCYELYHQLRTWWPNDTPYRVNGEVDKRGHPVFQKLGSLPNPDLLVHVPGTMESNYAVIEVKRHLADREGIDKDLMTLTLFTSDTGYTRGIYLVFGEQADDTIANVRERARILGLPEWIDFWSHRTSGHAAELVDTLK